MVINEQIVNTLKNHSVPLQMYFVLYCISNNLDWYKTLKEDRVSNIQYLTRRGFLKSSLEVTDKGIQLLNGQLKVVLVKKALNQKDVLIQCQADFSEF